MDGKTQIHHRPHVWTCNSKQPAWASRAAAVDMLWVQTNRPTQILQYTPAFLPLANKAVYSRDFFSPSVVWHLICLYFDLAICVTLFNALLTADHVSHLENVSEEEINRLLGMVVDVENLFMSVHKEEDTDTKQVYFYLFKVSKNVSHISVTVCMMT